MLRRVWLKLLHCTYVYKVVYSILKNRFYAKCNSMLFLLIFVFDNRLFRFTRTIYFIKSMILCWQSHGHLEWMRVHQHRPHFHHRTPIISMIMIMMIMMIIIIVFIVGFHSLYNHIYLIWIPHIKRTTTRGFTDRVRHLAQGSFTKKSLSSVCPFAAFHSVKHALLYINMKRNITEIEAKKSKHFSISLFLSCFRVYSSWQIYICPTFATTLRNALLTFLQSYQ